MTNEYGTKLDPNGYAPSILQDELGACCICGRRTRKLDRHEVFYGAYRKKSKALGLWVEVCHIEHHIFGPDAVHNNRERDLVLKRQAQRKAMEVFEWTIDEFITRFGRNYLEEV